MMDDMIRSLRWALEWREMSEAKRRETAYSTAAARVFKHDLSVEHFEALEMRDCNKRCAEVLSGASELWTLLQRANMSERIGKEGGK